METQRWRSGLAAGVLVCLACGGAEAQVRYSVTNLGLLPNGSTAYAQGINNRGQIVGAVGQGLVVSRAFLWERGVMTEPAGTLGGPFVQAFGINNAGVIVGEATDGLNRLRPVKWVNGQMIELPTLGGDSGSARAINESGDAVGYARVAGNANYRAAMWIGTSVLDLGSLAGEAGNSQANAVTDDDMAFGFSDAEQGLPAPALWGYRGIPVPLATLDTESAQVLAVNRDLVAVGSVRPIGQEDQAALFMVESQYAPLGRLTGDISSKTLAINNRNIAVGYSKRNNTTIRAVVWNLNGPGGPVDLNTLLPAGSSWQLQVATAINDRGWIAGWGLYNGSRRAFLLRPSCTADITNASGSINAGPDGFVTGEDFDLFVQAFFTGQADAYGIQVADIATAGTAQRYPDGFLTGEDYDVFVQAFFTGCP